MKRAKNCLYNLQTTQLQYEPGATATFYLVLQNPGTPVPSLFIHGFLPRSWKQPKSTKRTEQYLMNSSLLLLEEVGDLQDAVSSTSGVTHWHRRRCTRSAPTSCTSTV